MRTGNSAKLPGSSKYPLTLPLDEAKNIVMYVTTGTILANLSDFAQDVWVVQGYAQGQILGNPDIKSYAAADAEPDEKGLAELQKAIASAEDTTAQGAINWLLILRWVVGLIISYYLSRKG
jgi:hypothetical protein